MSELEDLLSDVGAELTPAVRKTIQTAIDSGWELNSPGLTLALRLNHPTDDLALPVYITWTVGRTPKGKLSLRAFSCGTQGLRKLSGADLLEYLQDPTVAYALPDEAQDDREGPELEDKWDPSKSTMENLEATMGARVVSHQRATAKDRMDLAKEARASASPSQPAARPKPAGLRVMIPGR